MLQLTIEHCHQDDVETLSTLLEEYGALSVTLMDEHDHPILEPAPGEVPLWPQLVIEALYEQANDAEQSMQRLSKEYPQVHCHLQPLPEKDWERVCLQDFVPQQFGQRLWICPSWLTPPVPDAINLILDPGLAFGTGTHPTTALCLTWLEQAQLNQLHMIDYGCGSGILAVAALKLGAAQVYAVDIDDQALLATQNNAFNNDIQATQITVSHPEHLHHPVDCIIANILFTPLLQLKQRFKSLLNPAGLLVVSGILIEQSSELITAYSDDFSHLKTMIDGDWALLVFQKTT